MLSKTYYLKDQEDNQEVKLNNKIFNNKLKKIKNINYNRIVRRFLKEKIN